MENLEMLYDALWFFTAYIIKNEAKFYLIESDEKYFLFLSY